MGEGVLQLGFMASRGAKPQVERRLRRVGEQLRSLRDDLRVTEEQLGQLADEADDARLRSLVSARPRSQSREHRDASPSRRRA